MKNKNDGSAKRSLTILVGTAAVIWVVFRLADSATGTTLGERMQAIWNDIGLFIIGLTFLALCYWIADTLARLFRRQ